MQTFGRSSGTGINRRVRVLFDGWPLVYQPGSRSALHLLELLAALPPGVDPWLALPAPFDSVETIPPEQAVIRVTQCSPAGSLRWTQSILAKIARQASVDLLHSTSARLPLFFPVPCLLSPVETWPQVGIAGRGLLSRLAAAAGQAGAEQSALLWPDDLPLPSIPSAAVYRLPVIAHAAFGRSHARPAHLPADYVLCALPAEEAALAQFVSACRWAAPGLTDDITLFVLDLPGCMHAHLSAALAREQVASPVVFFSPESVEQRAAVYSHALAAVILEPPGVWSDPFLYALRSGLPAAGWESVSAGARLGSSGYLIADHDERLLGSAILSLLVDEPFAQRLAESARERSAAYQANSFSVRLGNIYEQELQRSAQRFNPG